MAPRTAPTRIISLLTLISFVLSATAAGQTPGDPFSDAPPQALKPAARKKTSTGKKKKQEEAFANIPEKPSLPPVLSVKQPADAFRCEREFIFKGERIHCDSTIRQDGERLRPLIQDVPEAVAELDTYQNNRRSIRSAAYIGSLGLLIALGGVLLSRSYTGEDGKLTDKGQTIRDVSSYGGIGIIGGTVIYGISTLQTNETHLGNAVRLHNEKHPGQPIELQFTTDFNL